MKKGLDCVLLFAVFSARVSADDTTLTTAVVRDGTTPKPTAIYGRIRVDPHVEEKIQAHDLFRLRAPQRRSRPNIWSWDTWCQLQPEMGNCAQNIIRYYYNAQLDQCLQFRYTGCKQNKNNFNTIRDCERHCKGSSYMPIKIKKNPYYCSMQPDAGICMALFYKYYYDVKSNGCKVFIYGGCGGNQNRFDTMRECLTKCHPDMSYMD